MAAVLRYGVNAERAGDDISGHDFVAKGVAPVVCPMVEMDGLHTECGRAVAIQAAGGRKNGCMVG